MQRKSRFCFNKHDFQDTYRRRKYSRCRRSNVNGHALQAKISSVAEDVVDLGEEERLVYRRKRIHEIPRARRQLSKHKHEHAQARRHEGTQARRQAGTQARRHTNTHTQAQTQTHTQTHSNTLKHTQTHKDKNRTRV